MYLGYHLYPYRSLSKRQIITEMPKFYLFDTALSNYLRKYEYQEMTGFDAGKSFEHLEFSKDSDFKLHVISFEKTKRIINLENKKLPFGLFKNF